MEEEKPGLTTLIGVIGVIVLAGIIYFGYSQLRSDAEELGRRAQVSGAGSMAELSEQGLTELSKDVDVGVEQDTSGESAAAENAGAEDSSTEGDTATEEAASTEEDTSTDENTSADEPTPQVIAVKVAATPPPQESSDDNTQSTTQQATDSQDSGHPAIAAAFNKGGCAGCHVIPGIPGANGQIGPDLSTIGSDAGSRIDGYSADEYIRESIVEPNAFIAPECPTGECPEGVMLQAFAQVLSPQDLDTIVAYLSALGTDDAPAPSAEAAAPVVLDTSLPAEAVLEPFMALPGDPASDAQIALGKHLFFDSRLSGNNSLSCASCHQPQNAFTDGEALSRGYPSTNYFRNTPTVYNTVFADHLYRDGRMDGGDMSTLVRDHIAESHFMSMDGRLMVERINQIPAYVELYNEAFGSGPGYGSTLRALAAYVHSLNSLSTPYDAYLAGDESALTGDVAAGRELFEANCSGCHSGALLSDGEFHNTGVTTDVSMFEDPERHLTFRRFFRILGTPNYRSLNEDVGLYAMTLDEADWGKFRTPSLREVARTAPYMHNGSLATLEEVVRFYNGGGGERQTAGLEALNLDDTQVGQLVAFLESLSSDLPAVAEPVLPDYEIVSLGSGEQLAAQETTSEESSAPESDTATAASGEEEVAEAAGPPSEVVVAAVTKGTCGACHMIPGVDVAVGQLGPDLNNIGTVGTERIEGYTAEEYIRESIINPAAFVVADCPLGPCQEGLMQPTFAQLMSEDELEALITYLVSLKGE